MQKRLLASLAGGLIGAAVTSTVNASLGLSPTIALIACSSIGLAIGYVASTLFDVFADSSQEKG